MSETAAVDLNDPSPESIDSAAPVAATSIGILGALSISHLLNDTIQSLLPSTYPIFKDTFHLDFNQIGWITFANQFTASLLQPLVGWFTDKRPLAFSLAVGMTSTLIGLILISQATSYPMLLIAAAVVGMGSAVFHPEASRIAHLAAGGKHGFAQSLFQVGGNFGTSLGPLLAAGIITKRGQGSIAWFAILPIVGITILTRVGVWYAANRHRITAKKRALDAHSAAALPTRTVAFGIAVLLVLVISKYVYLVSLTNFYTFYLKSHFGVTTQTSQIFLFVFLFAVAAGTFAGGPLGDRLGRKIVIWVSILGVAPFSLALPHLNLPWTVIVSFFAGFILASAFSAILVFAQELVPGRVGLIAGLFFGFAFGVSGLAAATLGHLADRTSIEHVFHLCAYLPLIGILTALLPNIPRQEHKDDCQRAVKTPSVE